MSDEKLIDSKDKKLEREKEKIKYEVNNLVCFACGEKIKENTNICPYCNTRIK